MAFRTAEEAMNPTPTQLVGRRKFVDVNNPAFRRGPLGQKLFERKKYETEQFNNIQKLAEERAMKAEAQKAKDAENRRRFDATQGAITKRAFRPYEVATQNAYDIEATSAPYTKDPNFPEGRPATRGESVRRMLANYPKANVHDPRIQDLIGQRPEQPPQPASGVNWLKDLVSGGMSALGKVWNAGKNAMGGNREPAAPEFPASASTEENDDPALAAMEAEQIRNSQVPDESTSTVSDDQGTPEMTPPPAPSPQWQGSTRRGLKFRIVK